MARPVATGLSNCAIADDLFVSLGTVKKHGSRILAKLGLESRVRVASWVGVTPDRGVGAPVSHGPGIIP